MVIFLRIMSLLGVVIFLGLFFVTFASPDTVERSAKSFVKYQIEKEIKAKQHSVNNSNVVSSALNMAKNLGLESKHIQNNLEQDLPKKIAAIIASMCGFDCEKKKEMAKSITSNYLERIKNIEVAQNTLGNIIKGKYLQISSNLKLDIRIFLGINGMLFLIILFVACIKTHTIVHLLLPSTLLFIAVVISSCIYVLGQDWFYTILYNDYMGFGYLIYVGVIFSLLFDIIINKARVTSEVINFIMNAIGSAFSTLPC